MEKTIARFWPKPSTCGLGLPSAFIQTLYNSALALTSCLSRAPRSFISWHFSFLPVNFSKLSSAAMDHAGHVINQLLWKPYSYPFLSIKSWNKWLVVINININIVMRNISRYLKNVLMPEPRGRLEVRAYSFISSLLSTGPFQLFKALPDISPLNFACQRFWFVPTTIWHIRQ